MHRRILRRDYLLDDEAGVHDIDGHRGVRDSPVSRRVELRKAAFRDRPQAEFLQKRTGVRSVSRAGHLRRLVSRMK